MPQSRVDLVSFSRSPFCRILRQVVIVLHSMSLPVFHLVLVLRLLPAMRVLVHVLHCSAHNALLASGHL